MCFAGSKIFRKPEHFDVREGRILYLIDIKDTSKYK